MCVYIVFAIFTLLSFIGLVQKGRIALGGGVEGVNIDASLLYNIKSIEYYSMKISL